MCVLSRQALDTVHAGRTDGQARTAWIGPVALLDARRDAPDLPAGLRALPNGGEPG